MSSCRGNGVDGADKPPDHAVIACHDGGRTTREVAMRAQALAHEIAIDRVDLEALDSFLMSDRSPPRQHDAVRARRLPHRDCSRTGTVRRANGCR